MTHVHDREKILAKAIAKKGVIIRAPSPQLTKDATYKYFLQFGRILGITKLDSGDILVQYEDSKYASAVLQTKHILRGIKVTIQSRKPRRISSYEEEKPSANAKITEKLQTLSLRAPPGSFDDELCELVTKFQASQKLRATKAKIVSELSEWLRCRFRKHVLHMYGSDATELDFEDNSDINFYLESQPVDSSNILHSLHQTETEEDIDPIDAFKKLKLKALKSAAYVLSEHPDVKQLTICTEIADGPYAAFLHIPSGIYFDLITESMNCVKSSKFIAALQILDPRIGPFLFALKLWARAHNIIGNQELNLTSYSVTLLGIFYLQRHEPALVPSVASLQSPVPADRRAIHDGWDYSYVLPERTADNGSSAHHSIFTLLKGFFDFYKSLDPTDVVICPFVGDFVPREKFACSPPALDKKTFAMYFKHLENNGRQFSFGAAPFGKQLAMQDPFELNINPTFHVQDYGQFKLYCEKSLNICCALERAVKQKKPVSITRLFTCAR